MQNSRAIFGIIIIATIILAAYLAMPKTLIERNAPQTASITNNPQSTSPTSASSTSPAPQATTATPSPNLITPSGGIAEPITNALSRVTKKPFGIYVSPGHSPVSPEKFTGFHTGSDFETLPEEQNIDVSVYAICDGKLLLKKYASGYGGVAVQACTINNNAVTVVYGHLRLSSILLSVGDNLKAGDKIAVLGTGYSSETDGERKHLHLGIHKGASVNILGYVQKQSGLGAWIDPLLVLK